jgi:hypothetical protein
MVHAAQSLCSSSDDKRIKFLDRLELRPSGMVAVSESIA